MTVLWKEHAWRPTAHACRYCLGRVLEAIPPADKKGEARGIFACSSCGTHTIGHPRGICGCGIRVEGQKAQRFRCVPNPAQGPANPAEIIIAAGQVPAAANDLPAPLPGLVNDNERKPLEAL